MVKGAIKLGVVAVAGLVLTGCATTSEKKVGNVTVRRYAEDRPRVDQEMAGNSGYLYGTPKYNTDRKDTRRMYYVEFSKDNPGQNTIIQKEYKLQEPRTRLNNEDSSYASDTTQSPYNTYTQAQDQDYGDSYQQKSSKSYYGYSEPAEAAAYGISKSDVSAGSESSDSIDSNVSLPQSYVIQKDDTLQKISKKFYGGYSKWMKIYEANKDVLKDPNTIIPGKTITIPAL